MSQNGLGGFGDSSDQSKRAALEKLGRRVFDQYAVMATAMMDTSLPRVEGQRVQGFYYYHVTQISKRWMAEERPLWQQMSEMCIGLSAVQAPLSVLFVGADDRLSVYVGTTAAHCDTLDGVLHGTFPQLAYETAARSTSPSLKEYDDAVAAAGAVPYRGFLRGNPAGSERFIGGDQLDAVIKGMRSKPWVMALFAMPVAKPDTIRRQQHWLTQASVCSELEDITYSESDNAETTTYKKVFYHSGQYAQKVEQFCTQLAQSVALGEWCVTVNYAAATDADARLLGALLTASFFGEEAAPEPIHVLYSGQPSNAWVSDGMAYTHTMFGEVPYPRYSTLMSSRELAILAAFPTVDTTGFAVVDHVEFDVHREAQGALSLGCILNSGRPTDTHYTIDPNEFNRHCLVVGLTGSGKTNTVKSILCGMTKGSTRPFLVIEPAKKEYWELYKLGYDDLQVYSVGAAEPFAHKLCINPFERAVFTDKNGVKKAVPIQTHIDFVYAAFKASFIMYTPMPYVLERAIYAIYEDRGWDIHNNVNTSGQEIYPTIEDLYHKIPDVVTEMGYDQKMRNDLIGSLQARINSLRLGTKGETLNVRRSFPMDRLLSGNVVIELEDIGDDDVKAFIISLLLVSLAEYRRQQEDCQLEVRHVVLIEEAHRLLKNVQSGSGENADPRGAAVEFFCNLLAELRSKGQGFIVADQIPSKLAPDLIKNTNLKIVHRTVAAEERELMGGAMHMTPEQTEHLASLKQGVAAMYSEGDFRPKLVRAPYAGEFAVASRQSWSREDVLRAVKPHVIAAAGQAAYAPQTNRPLLCLRCEKRFLFFCDRVPQDVFRRGVDQAAFYTFCEPIDYKTVGSCNPKKTHQTIGDYLQQHGLSADHPEAEYCLAQCLLEHWGVSRAINAGFTALYAKEF